MQMPHLSIVNGLFKSRKCPVYGAQTACFCSAIRIVLLFNYFVDCLKTYTFRAQDRYFRSGKPMFSWRKTVLFDSRNRVSQNRNRISKTWKPCVSRLQTVCFKVQYHLLTSYKRCASLVFFHGTMPIIPQKSNTFAPHLKGKMLEWFKRHAWKACSRQNWHGGSNPPLSAESRPFAHCQSAIDILAMDTCTFITR